MRAFPRAFGTYCGELDQFRLTDVPAAVYALGSGALPSLESERIVSALLLETLKERADDIVVRAQVTAHGLDADGFDEMTVDGLIVAAGHLVQVGLVTAQGLAGPGVIG